MKKQYQKSTLSVNNTTTQTVVQNGTLSLNNINEFSGCSISFVSPSSVIKLTKPGLYYISVDATVNDNGVDGVVELNVFKNNKEVTGASSSVYVAETTDTFPLSIDTIIEVPNSCCFVDNSASITLVNTGVSAIYSNVNVQVFKMC